MEIADIYNHKMSLLASQYKNMYFMSVNQQTVNGPHGEILTADFTHKLIPNGPPQIPPSLNADLQFIYNLH